MPAHFLGLEATWNQDLSRFFPPKWTVVQLHGLGALTGLAQTLAQPFANV